LWSRVCESSLTEPTRRHSHFSRGKSGHANPLSFAAKGQGEGKSVCIAPARLHQKPVARLGKTKGREDGPPGLANCRATVTGLRCHLLRGIAPRALRPGALRGHAEPILLAADQTGHGDFARRAEIELRPGAAERVFAMLDDVGLAPDSVIPLLGGGRGGFRPLRFILQSTRIKRCLVGRDRRARRVVCRRAKWSSG